MPDREVEGLYLDMRVLVELAERSPERSRGDSRRPGSGTGHGGRRRRPRIGDGRPRRAGPDPRGPGSLAERRGGRRARPHRLRLAVAPSRDQAQVRPDVLQSAPPPRALPRAPLRLQPGRAVPMDEGRLSRALRTDRRAGPGRAVGTGRGNVGRARHQCPLGRVPRPPVDRTGSGSSPRSSASRPTSCGSPMSSAIRRHSLRSPGQAGVDRAHHPEDELERHQRPSPTPPSGGRATTAAGCSPTSPRPTPTTATSRPAR